MKKQQDPRKHPFYNNPKMGNMKGWRFLEIGEVLLDGDEWFDTWDNVWYKPTGIAGEIVKDVAYRRKINVNN